MTIAATQLDFFGGDHLGALAVIAFVIVLLSAVLRRAASIPDVDNAERAGGERALRRSICVVLFAILLANMILDTANEIATGTWRFSESLPLHLCDFAQFAALIALAQAARAARRGDLQRGRHLAYELVYFWSLGGSAQALLTPAIDNPFPTLPYFTFFTSHGGNVVTALVLTIGVGQRPRPSSVVRVIVATLALVPPIMLANWAFGANYMYLCGPPPRPSLYDLLGPWPGSLIPLAAVAVFVFGICYAPFVVADALSRRRSAAHSSS